MTTMSNEDSLSLPQILELLNRVFTLLQFDVEWDIDETVEGNEWTQMGIDELSDKLGEDFKYKFVDEYRTLREEGAFK